MFNDPMVTNWSKEKIIVQMVRKLELMVELHESLLTINDYPIETNEVLYVRKKVNYNMLD